MNYWLTVAEPGNYIEGIRRGLKHRSLSRRQFARATSAGGIRPGDILLSYVARDKENGVVMAVVGASEVVGKPHIDENSTYGAKYPVLLPAKRIINLDLKNGIRLEQLKVKVKTIC